MCGFKPKPFSWQRVAQEEIPDLNEASGLNKGLIKMDKQNVICAQHGGGCVCQQQSRLTGPLNHSVGVYLFIFIKHSV